jgi:glycosyltransferase involved in cell wall biosynthesis
MRGKRTPQADQRRNIKHVRPPAIYRRYGPAGSAVRGIARCRISARVPGLPPIVATFLSSTSSKPTHCGVGRPVEQNPVVSIDKFRNATDASFKDRKAVTHRQSGKFRILVVAGTYPPNITGGGEIATQILAEGFAETGADVRVLTCGHVNTERHERNTTVDQVVSPNLYWRFGTKKNLVQKAGWHALDNYNPRTFALLRRKIRAFHADMVVTSILDNFGATSWLAARAAGVPVVDVIHSYYLECLWGGRFRCGTNCIERCARCKVATFGKRHLSKYVDGVVGVSRFALEAHLNEGYFPNACSTVIYNPVVDRAERSRTSRGAQPPIFGYLGKLLPTKGIEQLIQAFSSGALTGHLLVAGDGDLAYEHSLRRLSNPESVKFLGWVAPAALFKCIDFLVFPSIWNEPFGRGIAEAMSQGIPVIGARSGGIPELIDDGNDGFLYDPREPGALEHALRRAVRCPYSDLSSAALAKSQVFAKDTVIDRFMTLFHEVRGHYSRTST